jgi:alcohol dehydrogenase
LERKVKAFVYLDPGKKALEDRPEPKLGGPTDAVVKIRKTTICGTDLHTLKGDVPTCAPGRILGHEGVGMVEEVGAAVLPLRWWTLITNSLRTRFGSARKPPRSRSIPLT